VSLGFTKKILECFNIYYLSFQHMCQSYTVSKVRLTQYADNVAFSATCIQQSWCSLLQCAKVQNPGMYSFIKRVYCTLYIHCGVYFCGGVVGCGEGGGVCTVSQDKCVC
jgi:hypothetical protein